MSIEEILVVFLVKVPLSLFGISQQCVGKLVQRVLESLVFFSADVDDDWFCQFVDHHWYRV